MQLKNSERLESYFRKLLSTFFENI